MIEPKHHALVIVQAQCCRPLGRGEGERQGDGGLQRDVTVISLHDDVPPKI